MPNANEEPMASARWIAPSTPEWNAATRRLWLRTVGLVLAAAVVLSPAIATLALLVSRFGLGHAKAIEYMHPIAWALGIAMNLFIWLWATRQALARRYPEGRFQLVPHSSTSTAAASTTTEGVTSP